MWPKVTLFLLLGYMMMTRSFAYLGLPASHLFVGEIALGLFLLLNPQGWLSHWPRSLFKRSQLAGLSWALLLFLEYGLFQVLRGIYSGYPILRVLQDFVFNLYPLYLFLGIWVGVRHRSFLQRFILLFAWANGLYGVAYLFVLNPLPYKIPGSPGVPVFGAPGGSAVAIAGLLLLVRRPQRIWVPLLLNVFVVLGLQVRAEWLGLLAGLLLWVMMSKRIGRAAAAPLLIFVLLSAGYLLNFSFPSPVGRGGVISTPEIVARTMAPINLPLAEQLSRNSAAYAGTITWRTRWWKAIWTSVHRDPVRMLFGNGYGYPLSSLVSYIDDPDLRTPHSVFFFALGYSGWVGVLLFAAFQVSLVGLLWRTYRLTAQPFGLVYLAMILAAGLFGNTFETPFGAIPFYLIVGLSLGPLLSLPERGIRRLVPAMRRTAPVGAAPNPEAARSY